MGRLPWTVIIGSNRVLDPFKSGTSHVIPSSMLRNGSTLFIPLLTKGNGVLVKLRNLTCTCEVFRPPTVLPTLNLRKSIDRIGVKRVPNASVTCFRMLGRAHVNPDDQTCLTHERAMCFFSVRRRFRAGSTSLLFLALCACAPSNAASRMLQQCVPSHIDLITQFGSMVTCDQFGMIYHAVEVCDVLRSYDGLDVYMYLRF